MADATILEAGGRDLRVSSPDRVIFPETEGTPPITKLDVVEYYLSVEDGIMRALGRRPTTLERWPKGVHPGIVLSTREKAFVESAQLAGCKSRRVIFRHILPTLASPLLTLAVLEFARAVIAEAALSFLGLGTQPPSVSWGLMIAEAKDYMFFSPWVIMIPGIALFVLVLGINLLGDGLRDLLRTGEGT